MTRHWCLVQVLLALHFPSLFIDSFNAHILPKTKRLLPNKQPTLSPLLLHRVQNLLDPVDRSVVTLAICRRDSEQVHVFDVREALRVLRYILANLLLLQQRQREILHLTPPQHTPRR